jgi:hypothetical protein
MTFHPRALLITASLLVLLWLATDLHWAIALGAATVVFDVLAFGVVGTSRR